MRRIVLTIFTLATFSFGAMAQNVNIPDANFKAYLVGDNSINTNMDTEIQVSEANAFTGTIQPPANSVSDVTGLEAFVNITHLIINFQPNLNNVDVSQNTNVTLMYLDNNNLSSLDISTNTTLEVLVCSNNNLSSLDPSNNTNLTSLFCNDNNIPVLEVSQSPNLTQVACSNNNLSQLNLKNISTTAFLNATGNPNLTCIEVDDVAAATAAWTNIDAQTSFSTSCSPIVNIPDANFKAYLVGNNSINTNMDSEIQVSEAAAFSGAINCYGDNISDLTGIEAFTALTELDCDDNNLTVLDVSQNTALTKLSCSENNISNLDVSQNTALEILWCSDNNLTVLDLSQQTALTNLDFEKNDLTTIDISQNTALINLSFGRNNLTDLDVSQNTALDDLYCDHNNLTTLDLSNNLNLEALDCRDNNLTALNLKNISTSALSLFRAQNNPDLTCIEVDDVGAATAAWTNIDAQTGFSEDCGYTILVTSISVQGQGGATTISTLGGTLQMEAEVFPMNATDNTYTWSVINLTGSADIDANGLLTAISDGTVKVGVTANDGSGVTGSVNITISNQSSSTKEQSIISNLSIYPNPTNAQIIIDADANIEALTILDIMGKTVKTMVAPNQTIDVSDLTKGIYFLQIQLDKTLVSRKMIKK